MAESDWSVSGLCVTTRPEDVETVEALLNERPGIEVHATDPATGKMVVVQERASIAEHRQGLRDLQELTQVLTAELVLHLSDVDDEPGLEPTGGTV